MGEAKKAFMLFGPLGYFTFACNLQASELEGDGARTWPCGTTLQPSQENLENLSFPAFFRKKYKNVTLTLQVLTIIVCLLQFGITVRLKTINCYRIWTMVKPTMQRKD